MGLARANDVAPKKAGKKKAAPAPIDYASIEHPYVVLLNKKLRSLKKKQEKIKSLEESIAGSNKTLNEQQLEVLANKPFVEKMAAELESLRAVFVETLTNPEAAPAEEPTSTETEEPAPVESTAQVAMVEDKIPATTADVVVEPEVVVVAATEEEKLEYVAEILKLLHAVSLHQALGHDVPIALDYFVKVLVGGTRPPAEVSFAENLAESMEEAKRFLTKSEKVLACDMSYQDLRDAVDRLVNPVRAAEPPAPEFTINFFAEPDEPAAQETNTVPEDEKAVATDDVATPDTTETPEPVVEVAPKSFAAATSSKRPNSGNRRRNNSPRNNATTTAPPAEGTEKPKAPRRQYKPKATPDAAASPAAPVDAAPKPRGPRPSSGNANKPSSSSPSPTGEGAKSGGAKAPRRSRQRGGPKKESETP
ncbi:hypothetical protein ACHHYP_08677 [Achlya hypogyna]|uniref:Uncharacterized protein n=1 Tax=Achlya hypogyna TaxID=1202772 RepID=A0A1V9ZK54_ACHHY|nr:hypothetical protein ACHHYP_08677 [Achlya hypogyna]